MDGWKQLAGDVNPLDYGGTFLDTNGKLWHWWPDRTNEERLVFVVDVESAPVCWANYDDTAKWLGVETLKDMPKEQIIMAIAGYHGWHNFDPEPNWFSRAELAQLLKDNGLSL